MPPASTQELVDAANDKGGGVAAFNAITLEHGEAIVAGAEQAQLPVIIGVSHNAVRYHEHRLAPLARALLTLAQQASVPVAVHLDHIEDWDLLGQAPELGISSAMFDASQLPYDDNVEATREAADWAHRHGMWLEAELGEVGGKDGVHSPTARTDPSEAKHFVHRTGVDALAVAVGTSHAMTSQTAHVDLELVTRLHDALPVPLVLHGSSGLSDERLQRTARAGIRKINIGTQLNIALTSKVRTTLAEDTTLVDPRKYLRPGRDAMAAAVAHLLSLTVNGSSSPSSL